MSVFRTSAVILAIAIAFSIVGCRRDTGTDAATSRVRAFHMSPDAPPVDVYVNGSRIISGLAFSATSGYLPVPYGNYLVRVFPAGRTDRSIINVPLTLEPGRDYSVFAIDPLAEIRPLVTIDDNSPPVPGRAKVRFVHASPDAPAVDIRVPAADLHLFANIPFGAASVYQEVAPGTYELTATPAGQPENVALRVPNVTLQEGKIYTIVAFGLAEQATLRAVAYTDN